MCDGDLEVPVEANGRAVDIVWFRITYQSYVLVEVKSGKTRCYVIEEIASSIAAKKWWNMKRSHKT